MAKRPTVPAPVTVRVPAKLNLHLSVGPRRDDGYHEVTTVVQAVSLYDEITAASAPGLTVEVTGEGVPDVPLDESNLAVRAARLLAERAGVDAAAHLSIAKGIPVAGGMGGGSADAVGALVACDALWGTECDRGAMEEIAASVGSDVPFMLYGGTALGTGRGETVTPVLARGTYHWVFALAERGLSTVEVYAEHDRLPPQPGPPPDAVVAALRSGDPTELAATLSNDLQAATLRRRPALRRLLDAGVELGGLAGLVSGSGPTCAFLTRSAGDAAALAAAVAGTGLCRSVRRAHGPVVGARIVDPGGT